MDMPDSPSELDRLQALRETGLLARLTPPEFQAICSGARSRFGVPMALVTLVDQDWLVDATRLEVNGGRTPRAHAFCDHTIRSDEVLVVRDLSLDPRFEDNPLVKAPPSSASTRAPPDLPARDPPRGLVPPRRSAARAFARRASRACPDGR